MNQRDYIIKSLKEDRKNFTKQELNSSGYLMKIWFYPEKAMFLYADQYLDYGIIKSLIDEKIIIFDKISFHQGEKMVLYVPNFTHLALK